MDVEYCQYNGTETVYSAKFSLVAIVRSVVLCCYVNYTNLLNQLYSRERERERDRRKRQTERQIDGLDNRDSPLSLQLIE